MPPIRKQPKRTRAAPPRPDTAVDLTSADQAGSPPALPHERDEGVGMTGGVPSARVEQAHRDVQRGVQDTSRAPEADRAYQQQKKKQ